MNSKSQFVSAATLPEPHRYVGDRVRGEIELARAPGEPGFPVFANNYISIFDDSVIFPSGACGKYMRIFHNSDLNGVHGTVLVPTYGDEVFLVRIFRHPIRAWSLEFPRGFGELGLSSIENASQEASEELGVAALDAIPIGTIAPDTGMFATNIHVLHVPLRSRPPLWSDSAAQQQEAIERVVPVSRAGFLSGLSRDEGLRGITCGLTLAAMTHALAKGILT